MLTFQIAIRGSGQDAASMLASFDESLMALSKLERMFIEPDGSFVWAGKTEDGQPWQVDGNLIDRGACLAYIELKGRCPQEQFDRILSSIGWPVVPLMFELTRRGVAVDEREFRQLAASHAGAV